MDCNYNGKSCYPSFFEVSISSCKNFDKDNETLNDYRAHDGQRIFKVSSSLTTDRVWTTSQRRGQKQRNFHETRKEL